MADLIYIEHEDEPDVWDLHYSGPWADGAWIDTGPFTDGVTYNYRAKRVIDGVESGYSNEDLVIFATDYIYVERRAWPDPYEHAYTGPIDGSPWTDTGPFDNGTSYYYKALFNIDGEPTGYSNEDIVVYGFDTPDLSYYYYGAQQ